MKLWTCLIATAVLSAFPLFTTAQEDNTEPQGNEGASNPIGSTYGMSGISGTYRVTPQGLVLQPMGMGGMPGMMHRYGRMHGMAGGHCQDMMQQGKAYDCGMMHHGKGCGHGQMHHAGRHQRHQQVLNRLDLIEARLEKIEAMLEKR
jgi:hypothetical protein